MSGKLSLRPLIAAHLRSFQGYSRYSRLRDFLTFVLLPLAAGASTSNWGPDVYNVSGVLAGVGVFTALLFGLLVNILNLGIKLRRDEALRPESRLVRNVDELFANVAWSVLCGLVLVVLLAVGAAVLKPSQPLAQWYVGMLVAVFSHVVLTVLMSLARLVSAYAQIGDLAPPRKGSLTPVKDHRSGTA